MSFDQVISVMMSRLEAVMVAIDAIYETPGNPEHWPTALERISDCFGGRGTLLFSQREGGRSNMLLSPALAESVQEYLEGGWWKQDVLTNRSFERGMLAAGNILTEHDLATPDELAELPFFVDLRRRHNLGGIIGGSVAPHPQVTTAASIQLPWGSTKPGTDDLRLAEHLFRHCERALVLSCQLEDLRATQESMAACLARLGCGILMLDHDGLVRAGNPAAEGMLGESLSLAGKRLHLADARARSDYKSAVSALLRDEPQDRVVCSRPIIVPRGEQANPLVLYVLPIRTEAAASVWSPAVSIAGLVVMINPQTSAELDPALVRDYLGLTLGEARIAAQVGTGISPREAAAKLNISEETVRTTLKRIFAKTGIVRQSELSSLLGQLSRYSFAVD